MPDDTRPDAASSAVREGRAANGSSDTRLGPGGEFDIVRLMRARWGNLARGLGDDAAVLDVPHGEQLVVSTDSSVERVHFRREWLTPGEIGYRAAASALSDLAAMAARPLGLLLALVLPDAWRDDAVGLADGVGEAARNAGAPVVGGDISRGDQLALAITVLGATTSPARRSAVASGDRLYVTGELGGPARALRALQAGRSPERAHMDRFARPVPRIREGIALRRRGATAMIDISDGLASELRHLAAASGLTLTIDLDRVPVMQGCSLEDAVRGGEEYELLLASPVQLDVEAFSQEFGLRVTEIGEAARGLRPTDGATVQALRGDVLVDLGGGHDHFST